MATSIAAGTPFAGGLTADQMSRLDALSQNLDQVKGLVDLAKQAGTPLGESAAVDVANEAMWRELAAPPSGMLTSPGLKFDDFGGTAISLPDLSGAGAATLESASMSTADLLQLLRTESRKTTELLLQATMESIQNLQSQIKSNSDSSIANLKESAEAQQKAEKLQNVMKVVKWAAIAVGTVVAAVAIAATWGAATPLVMAGISAAIMLTTTVLGQVKGQDGKSVMDNAMEGLSKGMQKLAEKLNSLPDWAQWAGVALTAAAAVGLAFLDPKSLSITLPLLAVAVVGALPDSVMSEEMKGQVMASIAMVGVMVATSVYAAGASASAGSSAASALNTGASSFAATARQLAVGGQALEATMQLASGGMGLALAARQFQSDKAQAEVMALQEMVKMLQTLLDGDSSFIQMLADIQAQLDKGVAQVVALEHQTNEKINTETFS